MVLGNKLLSFFRRTVVGNYLSFQFFKHPFEIIRFIRDGRVFLEFKKVTFVNFPIPVSKLITINKTFEPKIKFFLKKRLRLKAILFNIPRFLFISYKFMFIYLAKYPTKKDLIYPIPLDIQRITGYY